MTSDTTPAPERHAFEPGRLVAGLFAVTLAALVLVNDSGVASVDAAVAGAALLLVAGAAIVSRAAVRLVGAGRSSGRP